MRQPLGVALRPEFLRHRGSTAMLALALAACAAPAAAPSPAPSAAPVTDLGYHNETSVAVNPVRPANVLATYQVPATVARSDDAGLTWTSQPLPGVAAFQLSGDPSVEFDADGNAYALYIAFDRPDDYEILGRAAHRNGIFVNRSEDGGRTWRSTAAPVVFHPEGPGIPFEDKPMLGTDRFPGSPGRGNVYVAWTQFRLTESGIRFSRSLDGGRTFSAPIEISDRPGLPKDSVGAAEGTDVAVARDGTVYVVWTDSVGIWLDSSADAGRTWGRDRLVHRTPDIVFGVPGVARANGYPSLAVDRRTGRMYVQWVDRRAGKADVYLSVSDDAGATWSAPVRVNQAAPGRDHFFAWMDVDPRTGAVVVGYYRSAPDGTLRYLLADSQDGGRTFRRRTLSERPFRGGGEFLGDYTGVAAYDGQAYAAWTEAFGDTAAADERVHTPRHASRVVVGRAAVPRD